MKDGFIKTACTYNYADSWIGESTQDIVFAGHNLIAENGLDSRYEEILIMQASD